MFRNKTWSDLALSSLVLVAGLCVGTILGFYCLSIILGAVLGRF